MGPPIPYPRLLSFTPMPWLAVSLLGGAMRCDLNYLADDLVCRAIRDAG